ncbi:hypothetical protein AMTR_s00040p00234920 [Amborella trichopoda]|uniref:Uncharacterized protein n=1 Tax=Amborella trichopoda TaxID=13333 RepID=W1PTC2_AMBTC|nr:hypothetical protein AMTR_s00040p00234920 [Amborella trichopoda]
MRRRREHSARALALKVTASGRAAAKEYESNAEKPMGKKQSSRDACARNSIALLSLFFFMHDCLQGN